MDTRRSASWTAGASVFSGRRDPEWPLPEAEAVRLEALWSVLEPLAGDPPAPPALGYRGCWAQALDGGRRLTAYRGAVTSAEPSDVRSDPPRAVERLVLGAAPDPVLRDQLFALAELEPPPT